MKLSYFLLSGMILTILVTIGSCSKSNSGDKPSISIKSINSPIPQGGQLQAELKFSKGANLSNGTLIAIRDRLNRNPPPAGVDLSATDTVRYVIPEFSADKGELEFIMPYQSYLHFSDTENDTLTFKFAVMTTDKKSSDTITSAKIVVISQ